MFAIFNKLFTVIKLEIFRLRNSFVFLQPHFRLLVEYYNVFSFQIIVEFLTSQIEIKVLG